MKKSVIYTKTGDKGETSLVSGNRLSKSHTRIDLYGEVDELNSHLGFAISLLEDDKFDFSDIGNTLNPIQSSLFDLGSRLACEEENWEKFKLPNVKDELIFSLEKEIDKLDSTLPKLKNFILPSGSKSASYFHIVRTVCRRVERKLVGFAQQESQEAPKNSLILLNRLSDYLFVVARYVNFKLEQEETPWRG